jgi:hypothetical protein
MKTPQNGDKLSREEVFNWIIKNLNKANTNSENGYDELCDLFEASFSYSNDVKIRYSGPNKIFEVYENTNYN